MSWRSCVTPDRHGPWFCSVYLQLTRRFRGQAAWRQLRDAFDQQQVRYRRPTGWHLKVGPRVTAVKPGCRRRCYPYPPMMDPSALKRTSENRCFSTADYPNKEFPMSYWSPECPEDSSNCPDASSVRREVPIDAHTGSTEDSCAGWRRPLTKPPLTRAEEIAISGSSRKWQPTNAT